MKLLKEMLIVLIIYFIGEFISKTLHLPVPGNILGMILLLVLLCTNIVKVEMVDTVSNFFLDHLAFFFIPAGVGLLTALDVLKGNSIKLLVICIVSTLLVIGITGVVVQALIKFKSKKNIGKGGSINGCNIK